MSKATLYARLYDPAAVAAATAAKYFYSIYMADSRSNREVKKRIFLKLSENVLQLSLDAPEFFQIF